MGREQRPGDWAAWMGSRPSPTPAHAAEPVTVPGPVAAAVTADAVTAEASPVPAVAAEPDPTPAPERAAGQEATGDTPRTARREATRQRLLDATREVIAEMGVAGATVEHICERAAFTRGAFYSNFTDKDDVIDVLVEREQNRLLDQLDAMFADVGREIAEATDLGAVLRAIIGRVLLAVPLDLELSLVQGELENFAIRRPDLGGRFIAISTRFRDRIAGFIVDAMTSNGRELLVDPVILTDAIIGISQRSVRSALLTGRGADPNAVSAAILPGLLLAFSRPVETP